MLIKTLNNLWQKKERRLSKILQKDIAALASVLEPVASDLNLKQTVSDHEIQWYKEDGKLITLFFHISKPFELKNVANCFSRTKEANCPLSCIFIHQWTDGEGSWDVFALHRMGLTHWNRFWGNRKLVIARGPMVKENLYNLFRVGRDFPLISRRKWARLFEESPEKVITQLAKLSLEFGCSQKQKDEIVFWNNSNNELEILFSLLPDPPQINSYINIYKQIEKNNCPITFVFQKEKEYLYNIFRFSAQSYLEHHNQIKL